MNASDSNTKTCTKCGEAKPATAEFFVPQENCKNGLRPACKVCEYAHRKQYRLEHLEQVRSRDKRRNDANREPVRQQQRAYSRDHREQIRERMRLWRAEHHEQVLESKHRYAKRFQDAISDRQKTKYANDAQYRQSVVERVLEWQAHNPDAVNARQSRRRARKNGNGGEHTADDICAQLARQKGKCFWCHGWLGKNRHTDHVVPLALGGSNGPENIVIACPKCNLSKGAKHPTEWAGMML